MAKERIGDVLDPLSAPASERYARFDCDGLVLNVEEDGRVLWIKLNRPSKVNAITQEMYNTLHNILDELLLDRQIRVVVLAAEGKNFSAGLDFDSVYKGGPVDTADSYFNQRKLSLLTLKLRQIPQPIITLMKGKAIGSGLAYALAGDVRIGDPTLEISVGANRMGAGGADIGLGYLLPRTAGPAAAAELMLTFRWLRAERCLRTGVVSDIVPPEQLEAEGREIARDMLQMSHAGLFVTKSQLNLNADGAPLRAAITSEDSNQIMVLTSREAKEINDRFRTRVQKDRRTDAKI
ncbi:enoyl-CoA hydratase/isomerase family protein [Hyaloraphidium curvatum]|nr:enoyl-CoA hydratase/isomerase family protein [Hyaloraphidium curvatum]